jgi:hypothetical protein
MDLDGKQESVAVFSDLHWGSRIDPRVTAGLAEYNLEIAKSRLTRWRDGVLRFAQMDQALLDVDTLHVLSLGDDIEGHGEMFDTQRLSMAESVGFQLFGLIDYLPDVLLSFLSRYKKVKVYKVRGNHGRISASYRGDYPPDNLELILWNNVADRVARQAGGKWTATPNGIRCLTGGKIDFYISPAFMMFIDIMGHSFAIRHGDRVGGVTRTYCVTPDTKILTDDLKWVPAGELTEGQGLLAFDDEPAQYQNRERPYKTRHFKPAMVTRAFPQVADTYRIEFANGKKAYATGEHKWLVRLGNPNHPWGWISTEELAERFAGVYAGKHGENGGKATMPMFVKPWDDTPLDYDAGLLAGAFDADGSLSKSGGQWPLIRFTQYENPLMAAVEAALTRKGFRYSKNISQTPNDKPIWQLQLNGGRTETLRFLGQIRPPRLLSNWMNSELLKERELRSDHETEIVAVRHEGPRTVIALTSSSGTYITEYGASHNTGLVDNKLRLNAIVGDIINYYIIGHHHEAQSIENEIGGEAIVNGCFVGPSLLSITMSRPAASIPSQELFLVHPKYGLTHRHRIRLATVEEMRNLIEKVG